MKFSILIFGIFLLVSCQACRQKENDGFDDLKSKIDSIMVNNHFNGVALLTKDTRMIYCKAIGYSDMESKTSIKLNDQLIVRSFSEKIIPILVLREYEKGKIGLDDKINQYLSENHQPWAKEVTVHQLLAVQPSSAKEPIVHILPAHTRAIVNKPLEFKQGAPFPDSKLAYELLANILENVTAKTIEALSTELFDQYGLENTFHPDSKAYKNLVKGYEKNKDFKYVSHSLPAGSFISNAPDLHKWYQLLYTGRLVKKETLALLKTKYATKIYPFLISAENGYRLLFKDKEENIQIGAVDYAPSFFSTSYSYSQTNIWCVTILDYPMNYLDDQFKVHTGIQELIKTNAQ